jgi:GT2 family glycosyltransferase
MTITEQQYPKVGLIILNWNNWRDSIKCIEGVRHCTYSHVEIWVVDNGSQDESIAQLSRIEDIHLISLGKNIGFAGGNNVGIRAALEKGCEYILLLNNDTECNDHFIEPLLEPLQRDSLAVVSCPKILYKEPPQTIWYAGGKFRQPRIIGELVGMGQPDQEKYNLMGKTDFAVGTCMLIKRDVFDRIGFLDERFFFYHEDVDFCYRANKAGYSIWYQPESVIIHRVSSSTENQHEKRVFLYEQARTVFLITHIRGFKIPIVIIMEIARFLRIVIHGMMHHQNRLTKSYLAGTLTGIKAMLSP